MADELQEVPPCEHPQDQIKVEKVRFKDGSRHLQKNCGICDKHLGYQQNPHRDSKKVKMHFGKYDGKTLEELAAEDREYLEWMLLQDWPGQRRLFKDIQRVLDEIPENQQK